MAFCLTIETKNKFKQALKDRKIDPVALSSMTSIARRDFLAKYVGSENAKAVNALFEGKLLLKNQKAGYISWAKKVAGITPEVKRDIISRIEKMDKILNPKEEEQFLQDLANARLGVEITPQEAKTVSDLSKKNTELKAKANKEGIFPTETDRLAYGANKVALEKYINNIKLQPRKVIDIIKESPGILKSLKASLDNSFWGRQGIKTLYTNPDIWFKNFVKSWIDIGKELTGKNAIDAIKTDIYSRPNALNGKYDAGGYGITVLSEEAYPSSLPERIPLLGRLFKASESAYNGAALRLRADLADRFIKIAKEQGVNTLSKEEAQGLGHLVGSLTGRGSLALTPEQAKGINVFFFSPKFLKSNFDTLTAHIFDKKASSFAKKQSAKALLKIIVSIASILTVAKLLDKDSVDEDPRSTNFGKIKIFGHWVDITGGMGSLTTLASRLIPTRHNGEWGFWMKNRSGNWTKMSSGQYGVQTAMDLIWGFLEGKFSPILGLARDLWSGENYQGEPITLENALKNLTVPLTIQNAEEFIKDPQSSNVLGSIILEGLGLSTSVNTYKIDWGTSTSAEMKAFKNKVGEKQFKKANDDFNRVYNWWYNQTIQKDSFKRLSDESKQKTITKAKANIKEMIFKANNFKYKTPKTTKQQKNETKEINKLLPYGNKKFE